MRDSKLAMVRKKRLIRFFALNFGQLPRKPWREIVTTFAAGVAIGCAAAVLFHLHSTILEDKGVLFRFSSRSNNLPTIHNELEEADPHEELLGPSMMKFGPLKHSSSEDYHDEVARRMTNEIRILCMIVTHNNKTDAIKQIKNTWGSRCNKLIFVSTFNDSELDVVAFHGLTHDMRLGMVRGGFNHVWQHYHYDADWFLRADDDTYAIMENLRYMLNAVSHERLIYYGLRLKEHVKQGYMSGESGYILSKGALKKFMNEAYKNNSMCRQSPDAVEDIEMGTFLKLTTKTRRQQALFYGHLNVGKCLEKLGIEAGDSRDKMGRHRFLIFHPKKHLLPGAIKKFKSSLWNSSYHPFKEGNDCCSDRAISFHGVKVNEMFVLEYFFYHLRPYGISHMDQPPGRIQHNESSS